ncbi:hypothetical protein [Fusobacterium animalis]
MWLTKAHTSQEAPTSISGSSSLYLAIIFWILLSNFLNSLSKVVVVTNL